MDSVCGGGFAPTHVPQADDREGDWVGRAHGEELEVLRGDREPVDAGHDERVVLVLGLEGLDRHLPHVLVVGLGHLPVGGLALLQE